jgi:hypothetical protein
MCGLKINSMPTNCMMSDKLWKVVFLTTILLIGDPFVTLKAQDVPPVKLAHITTKT